MGGSQWEPTQDTEISADHIQVHYNEGETLSVAVPRAIADLEGIDVTELPEKRGFLLYNYLVPDALDALVANSVGISGCVELQLSEYQVEISSGETVTVTRTE